jgi:hypothetical protein
MEAGTRTDAPAFRTNSGRSTVSRLATETKAAFKTTEFFAFLGVLAGVLIAGLATKAGDDGVDVLAAKQVWLYAVILTVGYMLSRGLAKSGSREPYTERDSADRD